MLYLDHAATSCPKAPGVGDRMKYYIDEVCVSVNRGVYGPAQDAALETLSLREALCTLFHHPDPNHIILTAGATAAINYVIKGYLHPGDHVLVSALEHNAVMRPLVQEGIAFDRIPCDENGRLILSAIPPLLRQNTRLLILCHASNVCGTIQDVDAISELCKLNNIPLFLDASQSGGHIPIDFTALKLAAMALPGHKGLLGPQGIGALLMSQGFAAELHPLIAGGTGSVSDSEELPAYLPDRFESGTPNLPGIYGWLAAVDYVNRVGISELRRHELGLIRYFLDKLKEIPHVRLLGTWTPEERVGVFGLDFLRHDNAEISDRLEQEYGILTRCGLHCAPAAHKALGSFPQGCVRFSTGYRTTEADLDQALAAIAKLA